MKKTTKQTVTVSESEWQSRGIGLKSDVLDAAAKSAGVPVIEGKVAKTTSSDYEGQPLFVADPKLGASMFRSLTKSLENARMENHLQWHLIKDAAVVVESMLRLIHRSGLRNTQEFTDGTKILLRLEPHWFDINSDRNSNKS